MHRMVSITTSRGTDDVQLHYAQVVKSYRRLVGVTHRVVFGTRLAIEQVLAACGWTINTAFIERLNLDIRQRVVYPKSADNSIIVKTS